MEKSNSEAKSANEGFERPALDCDLRSVGPAADFAGRPMAVMRCERA
jgi:hypothetical protein